MLAGALCLAATSGHAEPAADAGTVKAGDVALVMVEQPGCHYCLAWHQEIGPAYPRTDVGRFAPLRTEQMRRIPDDLDFARRVAFTPTFVVVDAEGRELGRLEGYPGADFFWPMIETLLAEKAGFVPATTN